MVYDVFILRSGRHYYDKFHLRGSAEEFDRLEAMLVRYAKRDLIDAYYMFKLSPKDSVKFKNPEKHIELEDEEDE